MRRRIIPVFIPHASCPNQCIFCDQNRITGVADLDFFTVKDTIEKCLCSSSGKSDDTEIAFYGGSFTAIDEKMQLELLKIAKSFIDKKAVGSVRVSTRPDYIDERTLERLKMHGVKTIELGVQSMSDEVLEANLRGHTSDDTVKASRIIRDSGFLLGHQIMPGLYKDTKETMLMTATECLKLKPHFLRIYPCLVVKGTKLFRLYEEGRYSPLCMEEAVSICKNIYKMANSAGVKVIRMGIHPEKDFIDKGLVAGPFHPAFKHLVISSLFSELIDLLVKKSEYDTTVSNEVTFKVNKKDVSNFIGINKKNLKHFKERYPESEVKLESDESIKMGDMILGYRDSCFKASIFDL